MTQLEKIIFVASAIGIIFIPLAIPAFIFFIVMIIRRVRGKPSIEVKSEEPASSKQSLQIKSAYSPGNFVRLKDGRRGRIKKSYNLWHDVMVDGKEEFLHEENIKNLL